MPGETAPAAPGPIHFTDGAALKVGELIAEEGNPGLHLRIFVTDGGCSGLQYGFAFEESAGPGDLMIEKLGVRFLVSPDSLRHLAGAEVGYQDDLEGSRFVIRNPNARSTCSCGNSFATAETGGNHADNTHGKSCAPRPQ